MVTTITVRVVLGTESTATGSRAVHALRHLFHFTSSDSASSSSSSPSSSSIDPSTSALTAAAVLAGHNSIVHSFCYRFAFFLLLLHHHLAPFFHSMSFSMFCLSPLFSLVCFSVAYQFSPSSDESASFAECVLFLQSLSRDHNKNDTMNNNSSQSDSHVCSTDSMMLEDDSPISAAPPSAAAAVSSFLCNNNSSSKINHSDRKHSPESFISTMEIYDDPPSSSPSSSQPSPPSAIAATASLSFPRCRLVTDVPTVEQPVDWSSLRYRAEKPSFLVKFSINNKVQKAKNQ